MNFLTLATGEIVGIIGAFATVFTVFIVPFWKWYKKQKQKRIDDAEQLHEDRERQQKMYEIVKELKTTVNENGKSLNEFRSDYDDFTIQNLKYMINDAFFSYHSVHEIPQEILVNACECCDIYVYKKNRNHEIKPRCKLLWEELERRSVISEEDNYE